MRFALPSKKAKGNKKSVKRTLEIHRQRGRNAKGVGLGFFGFARKKHNNPLRNVAFDLYGLAIGITTATLCRKLG